MDEFIHLLSEAAVFSSLNAKSGYGQAKIKNEDRDKNTFALRYGLYRYLRKPFELESALSTVQRSMNVARSADK